MGNSFNEDDDHADHNHSLIRPESSIQDEADRDQDHQEANKDLSSRFWIESKKLWHIVGPTIFSRIVSSSMNVITVAFGGHLGDVEFAAISISLNVIAGFNFGFMLGMASALETLCGQAFGAKRYYMLGIYLQRSWIVLFLCGVLFLPIYVFAGPIMKLIGVGSCSDTETILNKGGTKFNVVRQLPTSTAAVISL